MSGDDRSAVGEPNPEGEEMVAEFQWVHGLVRRQLEELRMLAVRVADGADADEVALEIATMAIRSPVWSLRVHCLQYCQFVHGHHGHEDQAWWPRLRDANPALNPVVDRLEAEHRIVADHLDAVEDFAARLRDETAARDGLVLALEELAAHLLTHLDYEEASIFPTLRGMRDWRRR